MPAVRVALHLGADAVAELVRRAVGVALARRSAHAGVGGPVVRTLGARPAIVGPGALLEASPCVGVLVVDGLDALDYHPIAPVVESIRRRMVTEGASAGEGGDGCERAQAIHGDTLCR